MISGIKAWSNFTATGSAAFDADFTNRGASNQSFPESSPNAALVTINGSARITHLDTENALVLPGVAGNYASVPDAAYWPTGDIGVFTVCSLSDWTPSGSTVLMAKRGGAGQLSWQLNPQSSGVIEFVWTVNGSTVISKTSTVAPTVPDLGTIGIGVTLDVDNGAGGYDVKFWYSTDRGATWMQLGATVTTAGTTSIFDSTTAVEIGTYNSGLGGQATERVIYSAMVCNNALADNTGKVLDVNFATAAKLATSFTESSSNAATVTINSTAIALPARIQGARDLYMGTAASQPKYLPWA
jgi:hypothetical protein